MSQGFGDPSPQVPVKKSSTGTLAGRLVGERLSEATLELPTGESIEVPLQ